MRKDILTWLCLGTVCQAAGLPTRGVARAAGPVMAAPAPLPAGQNLDLPARPILLIGPGYGKYERLALRRDILEPGEITYEDGGDWTSAEIWGNYSEVIVTQGFPALNDREIDWIRLYLNNGGKLLLMGPVLASLRDLRPEQRDWLGAGAAATVATGDYAVPPAGEALVPDAATAEKTFGRLNNFAGMKLTTAAPLVTRDGKAVLFHNTYGRGDLWFFGCEYFRILATEKIESERLKLGAAPRQLLQKLVALSGAQQKHARVADGLKAWGAALPVVWRRDFSEARGAAYADPPFPRPGEELRTIHLDLGMDEWESVPFFVSSSREQQSFAVSITDLQRVAGADAANSDPALNGPLPATSSLAGKIAARDLRLRVQGVPDPALTVGPFWLLDTKRSDAAASSEFALPLTANTTTTAWVTLRTHGVAPGLYRGQAQFNLAGMPPLQLEVRIWPVHLPGREYFAAEATSQWSSLLAAPKIKTDVFGPELNLPLFDLHTQNIADHGITANMDGSWADRWGHSFSLKNVKLAGTDLGLEDAIRLGKVDENQLPALDFSYFDPLVEPLLAGGVTHFDFLFKNLPTDWLVYARIICGDPELTPDSPHHERIKRWLLGECVRYLHEKGIREINTMIADEIPPAEIPSVTRRASLLQDGGLKVGLTTTGEIGRSPDLIGRLNPAIDRWIWNMTILPGVKQSLKTNPNLIDATDQQFTYLADWHRAPYVSNRAIGPFCAHFGLDGILFHGYLRWYPNGGGVFSTPAGPIDTEGWEGARDGIEDARYLKELGVLLDAAHQLPALREVTSDIESRTARWVSADAGAYLRLDDRTYGVSKYVAPVATYQSLQQFKAELLQALQTLQALVDLPVSATYGNVALERKGIPLAGVSGAPAAVAALNQVLTSRGIIPLLSLSDKSENMPRVLIGSQASSPAIAALLAAGKFQLRTPVRAGDYQIHLAAKDIVIYALDEEGGVKGAQIFGQVVDRSVQPAIVPVPGVPHDQN